MEANNNATNEVLLCSKCLAQQEYFIPLYHKNETTNEIEYECSKSHSITKNDVISMNLDDDLIRKLNTCEIHKEIYCGWSEDDSKNLCFYDIGIKLTNKEKYLLFIDLIPDTIKKDLFFQTIDSLKQLLNKYLSEAPEAVKQINNIKSIVNIFENSWLLLYKFNIQNYQTINNMKYSLTMMPSQNELEYLYKEFLMCLFGDLISGITKKKINDINVKELYSQFNKDDEIIPLIENKKEQYCVILDKNGLISVCQFKANKIINKLYDDFSFKNGDCIMPYNENIIIILKEMALLIIDFINNKKYNLDLYNYLFTLVNGDDRNYFNLEDNEYFRRFYFRHILAKNPNAKNDLIKIDQNNILLIYCKKVCLITFDDFLSKITNFIILENHNDIVKASQIFYKSNNVVKKGIIIISEKLMKMKIIF